MAAGVATDRDVTARAPGVPRRRARSAAVPVKVSSHERQGTGEPPPAGRRDPGAGRRADAIPRPSRRTKEDASAQAIIRKVLSRSDVGLRFSPRVWSWAGRDAQQPDHSQESHIPNNVSMHVEQS